MKDAPLESTSDFEARVGEDAHHAVVVDHDIGIEHLDVVIARDISKHFEHSRSDAASLQRIGDSKARLGAFGLRGVADIGRDSDQAVPRLGDEHEFIVMIGP